MIRRVEEFESKKSGGYFEDVESHRDGVELVREKDDPGRFKALSKAYRFTVSSGDKVVSLTSEQIFQVLEIIYDNDFGNTPTPPTLRSDISEVARGLRSDIRKSVRSKRKIEVVDSVNTIETSQTELEIGELHGR